MNLVNKTFSLSLFLSGYPKMEVCQEYYGLPPPPVGFGQPLHLSKGDIIELSRADADLPWWEVTKPCIYILCILTNEWDSYCCVFELCFLWLMCRCDMLLPFSAFLRFSFLHLVVYLPLFPSCPTFSLSAVFCVSRLNRLDWENTSKLITGFHWAASVSGSWYWSSGFCCTFWDIKNRINV